MGILRDKDGKRHMLRGRHILGRSRSADTPIDDSAVSGHHASLWWTGAYWVLRDLGSRNGTVVGDERLATGGERALSEGDTLYIGGRRQVFVLVSAQPPVPFASRDDEVIEGEEDMLALPSSDDPAAIVASDGEGGWSLLVGDEATPVVDGAEITVGEQVWTLRLPEVVTTTIDHAASAPDIEDVGLAFRVSADEEYVEVDVVLPSGVHRLPPRSHHYPLLTLARVRLDDDAPNELERGWVYYADLQKMLRVSANQLHVSIHRARKELEALGVLGAASLVERRRTTQQVRLGVGRLTVSAL